MRRKTLVIGAGGQLGRALSAEFRSSGEVIGAVHRHPSPGQQTVDLSDTAGLVTLLNQVRPDWIFVAGAFCNVDLCETDVRMCRQVNAEGPGAIAQWARDQGGIVVYYSTDHVFDGSVPICLESDPVHPLNVYASSKAEGEQAIRSVVPQAHLILRTSGLYGPDATRKNFVIRLVDQLKRGGAVRLPSDQWGSPTFTEDLARVTRFLLEKDFRGTYHAVGPDHLLRAEFARRICACFDLDERQVVSIPTSELHQQAKRPLSVRLSTEKLKSTGAPAFRSVQEGLAALRHQLFAEIR